MWDIGSYTNSNPNFISEIGGRFRGFFNLPHAYPDGAKIPERSNRPLPYSNEIPPRKMRELQYQKQLDIARGKWLSFERGYLDGHLSRIQSLKIGKPLAKGLGILSFAAGYNGFEELKRQRHEAQRLLEAKIITQKDYEEYDAILNESALGKAVSMVLPFADLYRDTMQSEGGGPSIVERFASWSEKVGVPHSVHQSLDPTFFGIPSTQDKVMGAITTALGKEGAVIPQGLQRVADAAYALHYLENTLNRSGLPDPARLDGPRAKLIEEVNNALKNPRTQKQLLDILPKNLAQSVMSTAALIDGPPAVDPAHSAQKLQAERNSSTAWSHKLSKTAHDMTYAVMEGPYANSKYEGLAGSSGRIITLQDGKIELITNDYDGNRLPEGARRGGDGTVIQTITSQQADTIRAKAKNFVNSDGMLAMADNPNANDKTLREIAAPATTRVASYVQSAGPNRSKLINLNPLQGIRDSVIKANDKELGNDRAIIPQLPKGHSLTLEGRIAYNQLVEGAVRTHLPNIQDISDEVIARIQKDIALGVTELVKDPVNHAPIKQAAAELKKPSNKSAEEAHGTGKSAQSYLQAALDEGTIINRKIKYMKIKSDPQVADDVTLPTRKPTPEQSQRT